MNDNDLRIKLIFAVGIILIITLVILGPLTSCNNNTSKQPWQPSKNKSHKRY